MVAKNMLVECVSALNSSTERSCPGTSLTSSSFRETRSGDESVLQAEQRSAACPDAANLPGRRGSELFARTPGGLSAWPRGRTPSFLIFKRTPAGVRASSDWATFGADPAGTFHTSEASATLVSPMSQLTLSAITRTRLGTSRRNGTAKLHNREHRWHRSTLNLSGMF